MNYNIHYQNLINRSKNRNIDGYKERHHIIPKCMGGTDSEDNLVDLTPEEHYVAHQLLIKIYPKNKKLINAAVMMIANRPSNKIYGWIRRKFRNRQCELQSGERNSQYGTMWIFNVELKENKKIPKSNHIPIGWERGRVLNFDTYKNKLLAKEERKNIINNKKNLLIRDQEKIKIKKEEEKETIKKERKKYILDLYDTFTSGNYYSVSEFHKLNKVTVSRMTLSKRWRKWIPEYKENSKEGRRFKL